MFPNFKQKNYIMRYAREDKNMQCASQCADEWLHHLLHPATQDKFIVSNLYREIINSDYKHIYSTTYHMGWAEGTPVVTSFLLGQSL